MSPLRTMNYKLLITVVPMKKGEKIVKATKKAGVEGATILLGRGTLKKKPQSFWSLPIGQDKEIVFSLFKKEILDKVLEAINSVSQLEKPGEGIAFVMNPSCIAGICHVCSLEDKKTMLLGESGDKMKDQHSLIVTIVSKGDADTVVNASCAAGAEGGTILNGRGSGIHEKAQLLGIAIEPEKEMILTIVPKEMAGDVLEKIIVDAELTKAGKGIAFILPVETVIGLRQE